MSRITTYTCGDVNSQRLYIADLRAYLRHDDSYLHFIKGTLLCFCRRGSARIKVNYTSYSLSDNDILAILPTHVFSIEQCDDSTSIEAILYSDEYWASVSHSIDYGLIRAVEHTPHASIPTGIRDEVFTMLALLAHHERQQERATGINGDLERSVAGGLAFSLLMLLVAVIYRSKADTPRMTTRKDILTHDFFELLSVHFETERKVAFYASRLCVTPKHLSAMVKQVTLLPIQEWINNVTVLNIKRRLLTTTDTVQQISEDLNFQTPSTFVRYFRQHTGVTPSRYRDSHRDQ